MRENPSDRRRLPPWATATAMGENFSQIREKAANLSVLMAKVQSMEIVVDEC
jgi:hypothetical protein